MVAAVKKSRMPRRASGLFQFQGWRSVAGPVPPPTIRCHHPVALAPAIGIAAVVRISPIAVVAVAGAGERAAEDRAGG